MKMNQLRSGNNTQLVMENVKPPHEKAPKKSTAKTTEKRGKTVDVVKEEKLDPLAEKLRQQRKVTIISV
uniref:Uncharacterized protein n=1 Tax=Salix viminalis TaxID=40686 RepID=A0A6N2NDW5_SALVM